MGRNSQSRFRGVWAQPRLFRKRHTKESGQMGVREKWELQTHSACDYRNIGPSHAVAILVM